MNITPLEVLPYDPSWSEAFKAEALKLKKALGDHYLAVHHIGSTSVPGLAAKPTIDILCVVSNLHSALALEKIWYVFRGEFNIPLRHCFTKRSDNLKVNLHAVEKDHGFIALNLCFRDYLRANASFKQSYQDLKYRLIQNSNSFKKTAGGFPKYTLEKDSFIKQLLTSADYQGTMVNFCLHDAEVAAAKHLRQKYFFDKVKIEDPYIWTFNHQDHKHFILYKGAKIVGYAHIQLWPQNRAALRIIVIAEEYRAQGFGAELLNLIEKWLKMQGYRSLHTESSLQALDFYKNQGYTSMPFDDPDGYESDPSDVPVGKVL